MSKTSEAAKELLDMIRAHQSAFRMQTWSGYISPRVNNNYPDGNFPSITLENIDEGNTTCGTTLCIAGFAAFASGWKQQFKKAGSDVYDVMVSPEGKAATPNYVKIGADFLDLPHPLAADLFLVDSNSFALELLERLADGEAPEEVLEPVYDECFCNTCESGDEEA